MYSKTGIVPLIALWGQKKYVSHSIMKTGFADSTLKTKEACSWRYLTDGGSIFLILHWRHKQYVSFSIAEDRDDIFLIAYWRQNQYFPYFTLKKRRILLLMKVGTSYQITRRQNPEDRKYDTYGEHLKKILRVGLYTGGSETVMPDPA